MKKLGLTLQKIGQGLMYAGGGLFGLIFITVILFGGWPDFLEPVQSRFQLISQFLGGFAFVAELAIFVGPGALVWLVGEKLANQNSN